MATSIHIPHLLPHSISSTFAQLHPSVKTVSDSRNNFYQMEKKNNFYKISPRHRQPNCKSTSHNRPKPIQAPRPDVDCLQSAWSYFQGEEAYRFASIFLAGIATTWLTLPPLNPEQTHGPRNRHGILQSSLNVSASWPKDWTLNLNPVKREYLSTVNTPPPILSLTPSPPINRLTLRQFHH